MFEPVFINHVQRILAIGGRRSSRLKKPIVEKHSLLHLPNEYNIL
jgi:hypothetical protein